MTYIKDLTEVSHPGYTGYPTPNLLMVGWLAKDAPFQTGATSEAFRAALKNLCDNHRVQLTFGHHVCEFCPGAIWGEEPWKSLGNGEIHLCDTAGTWFAAPCLIIHYVEKHDYLPPRDFINAVLSSSKIGTDEKIVGEIGTDEKIETVREIQKRAAPPIDVDEIVQREIQKERKRRPWWRFW